jgi:hypothetical protein
MVSRNEDRAWHVHTLARRSREVGTRRGESDCFETHRYPRGPMAQRNHHDPTGHYYTERYGGCREGWRRNQLAYRLDRRLERWLHIEI